MKGRVAILFLVISLTVSVAYSQETGDNQVSPPPSPSPMERLSTLVVEITPKFQMVDLDRESSKAREYRALPEGLYIDRLLFHYETQTREFGGGLKRSYLLTHLIDDGYGELSYRRYGLLDVDLSLSRSPRVFSSSPPADLSVQRDTYDLRFKFTPGDRLIVSTHLSVEERKGKRPLTVESFTGLTGSPTAIIEMAEPVDYTTTTVDLGLEYLDDVLDIQLNNILQVFSNSLRDEVRWDNPYKGSDGRAKTADDYTVHTLSVRPAVKLGENIKLLNTFSYSKVTSSIDLIPFTTVSGVGETFLRDVLDTDVRSLTLSSILSLQPLPDVKLNITYRYYSYQNDTPKIKKPPAYVMIDGDSSAVRYPRIPRYTAYSTQSIGLDGAWSLSSRLSVEADIEQKDTSREEREVDKEDEDRITLALRSRFSGNLSGKFGYTHIRRRGDYDPTYYNTVYDPDPANDVTQHPLMRSFDLSRLDSDSIAASADYSPFDVLSLGSKLTLTISHHPSVDIGRKKIQSESVSIYAQYTSFRDLLLYSEYYYDRREIEGSYTWTFNSNLTYSQDSRYSDFTTPFTGKIEDITNVYVIGFDYDINQRLSIMGRYSKYDSSGKGINLPEVSSTTDIYELNASYSLSGTFLFECLPGLKDMKMNAGYSIERYKRDDYALDNFPVGVPDPDIDADIFLGIREPDYRLSIFSASLSLYF